MKLAKGLGDFFGLDIGTNAVRVVQLSRSGTGWNLAHYGYTPVDAKLVGGDSPESKRRLGEAITTAVGQAGDWENTGYRHFGGNGQECCLHCGQYNYDYRIFHSRLRRME